MAYSQEELDAAKDLYEAGAKTHSLVINNPLPPEGVELDGAIVYTSRVPSSYNRGHTTVSVALGPKALGGFAVMNNADSLLLSLFPNGATMELEAEDELAGATVTISRDRLSVDGTVFNNNDSRPGVYIGDRMIGRECSDAEVVAAVKQMHDPELLASAASFVARVLEHAQQR
jgi:hypothetical protein